MKQFQLFGLSVKHLFSLLIKIAIVSLLLLIGVSSQSVRSVWADAPFVEVYRDNHALTRVIANGVGTRGDPLSGTWTGIGSFDLDIPDSATIMMARLIWTGRSNAFDADGVQLARDGAPLGTLTADPAFQFTQNPWCCGGAAQLHESVDVTSLVQPGLHTYTVSDHEHGIVPIADNLNYGVGIWAVYRWDDPVVLEPNRETVVYQGQDSFFRSWTPPRGPHSEVRCADYTADSEARKAQITHLVSGIDYWDTSNSVIYRRSVAFWYKSATGTKPPPDEENPVDTTVPALSLEPGVNSITGANPGEYPIQSYAGLEWDNFGSEINVDADDSWTCFQLESGDSKDLAGLGGADQNASGMWNLFAISVFGPTAVDLLSFEATAVSRDSVIVEWETSSEDNNFGFNIYRNTVNDFASAELIHFEPGSSANMGGAAYSYLDKGVQLGSYYYWLEDIDTGGGSATRHGPVQVQVTLFNSNFLPLILKGD